MKRLISTTRAAKFFVLLLTIFSCSETQRPNSESFDFEQKIELAGEQVFEDEFHHIVEVAGDYLLLELNSRDTSENVYNIYDASSLAFLGSVGKRGQGPGEFYGAQYAGQYYEEDGDTFIWVNDAPQYRITSINVTESLKSGKTVFGRVIKHHPKYNFQNALYVVGADLVGYQPGYIPNTNKYPLHILRGGVSTEIKGNVEGWVDVGDYPPLDGLGLIPNGESFIAAFNRASIAMKPDQSRFVVAMKHYDRLDIFGKDGEVINSIRHPEMYREYSAKDVYAPNTKFKLKDRFDYYQRVVTSDSYIYALYYNRNMREYNDEMGEGVEVRVFDWDGELKFLLECPDDLLLISIDEKNKTMYGNVYEEQKFMRYSLKSIL